MGNAHQSIEMPVQKSTSGGISLTRIESPLEMENWGEEVNGPLSPKALSVIEEFFGVKPTITSWFVKAGSEFPNAYKFPVLGMARGTDLSFRIWQYGVSNNGRAEIDIYATGSEPLMSSLSCATQKVTWVGIGHSQLLVATEHGVLYRVVRVRQRSSKQGRRGLFWRFSKVMGFHIEMRSLRDHLNGFVRYVPTHLR